MIDLKACVKAEMEKIHELVLQFPWEDKMAYALWCASTYQIVRHSTRLVALAAACLPPGPSHDALHARFVDHAREERGHEKIAIHDLEEVGSRLEDLPIIVQAVALAQVQYYWTQYRGVSSLFGYILFLECLAVECGPELYQRVAQAHGKKAANFLRVHTEDDVEHTEKAFLQVNALPENEKAAVAENLKLSGDLYRSMLIEIRSRIGSTTEKRAA